MVTLDNEAGERLLEVFGSVGAAPDARVRCPVAHRPVRLQRCAFCQHGHGLLLDCSQGTLSLRCGAPPEVALKP